MGLASNAAIKRIAKMSRLKTPQQKKQASYTHDRVEGGEYPHADRRNRPRLKAREQRQLRRASKQMLASKRDEFLQLPERPRLRWGKNAVPLPEHLIETERNRIEREAHNVFRKGYGPATHARFRRMLQSWMKGKSQQSASLADFYRALISPNENEHIGPQYQKRRHFLRRFFNREPKLKRSFENWIALFGRTADAGQPAQR
jgi:hypothetical protein